MFVIVQVLFILSIKLFNIDVLISELNLAKFEFRLRSKNDYIQLNLGKLLDVFWLNTVSSRYLVGVYKYTRAQVYFKKLIYRLTLIYR